MIGTYLSKSFDNEVLKHQELSNSRVSKYHPLQNKPTNQDISNVSDLRAFNLWIENETSTMCHSIQNTSGETVTLARNKCELAAEAEKLKNKLLLRKLELKLALAEREFLLGQSFRTKNNITKAKSVSRKISNEKTQGIRINGVSKRCGFYNDVMH